MHVYTHLCKLVQYLTFFLYGTQKANADIVTQRDVYIA